MWFFNEPLWLYRSKRNDFAFQGDSLDPFYHNVRPTTIWKDGSPRTYLEHCRNPYRFEDICTCAVVLLQTMVMYAFLYTVALFYGDIREMFGMTHAALLSVLAAGLMANFIAAKIWNAKKGILVAVKIMVLLASFLSTGMTLIYLKWPGAPTFVCMVVLKGFLYGFIMRPTHDLAGHYLQVTPGGYGRILLPIAAQLGPLFLILWIGEFEVRIEAVFWGIFFIELISLLTNMSLSMTLMPKRMVTKTQLMDILIRAALNSPYDIPDNHRQIEGRKNLKQTQANREPSTVSDEFLNLFGNYTGARDDPEKMNPTNHTLEDLESWSPEDRDRYTFTIFLFTHPWDNSWFYLNPKMRWAVLSQCFLKTSLILVFFLPSLCTELVTELSILENTKLFSTAHGVFLASLGLYYLLVLKFKMFRFRTIIWMSAIATAVLCYYVRAFDNYHMLLLFVSGIGAFGVASIALSVDHIAEFYDEEGTLATAMDTEAFCGTGLLCLFLIVNGVVLDHVASFAHIYKLTGCFLALGAVPVFLSWLRDACVYFHSILTSCCSSQDDDEESRPLRESYVEI